MHLQQIGGDDPVEVALSWSADLNRAATVILATTMTFADALASGFAQAALNAPLLLTPADQIDSRVLDKLTSWRTRTCYLLGGPVAISTHAAVTLSSLGIDVHRLEGPSRLETAAAIAGTFPAQPPALICRAFPTGSDPTQAFADTLAAGGAAAALHAPLLLTETQRLSPAAHSYLSSFGTASAVVIGGTAAIDDQVVADLTAIGVTSHRVGGDTRFDTAALINAMRGDTDAAATVILIDGQHPDGWVDGFCAARLAAQHHAPILLANGPDLPAPTVEALRPIPGDMTLICGATLHPQARQTAYDRLAQLGE